ncbi:hypothetical protein AVEN_118276-1 [Araneus ventricosus]|uniref:SHSP domain-containing protein n=1 Tax=Araneus ventricosus TaxID=182803 RepID=A0A4Y2E1K1_ARAVE|nr:hypothetical protein AVEN_118276-1 [Araneus ventricosus]
MDREIKAQEVAVGQGKRFSFKESDFVKKGLVSDKFVVGDPHLAKKLCECVLDEYQSKPLLSQGTQTLEGLRSAPMDDATWNEQLERTKRSLAVTTKRGTKSAKPTSEYFDRNSFHETMSGKIRDRFTALNLKLSTATPEDFKIYVDCKQFDSSEVKVGVKGDFVVVHAKHQHKFDDHGMIRREFTRRWRIPEGVKRDKFCCLLDRHNILTIRAPRKPTSITVPVQIETSQDWKTSEV